MSGAKKYNNRISHDVSWAHDVSTVVALLNDYADLFSINACSKEQFLDAVRANSMYLRELADSIAHTNDTGAIDSGNSTEINRNKSIQPSRSIDAVSSSIRKVCEAFSLAAKAKSIEVLLNLSGQQGGFTNEHAIAIERIVANLLGNAIEHSGATRVEVKTSERLQSGGHSGAVVFYCLEVSDNGQGLAPEIRSRLLDTTDNRLPGRHVGSRSGSFRNRGLYGVKALATNIGARLWVTSNEGQGTTIGIELPPLEATAPPSRPTLPLAQRTDSSHTSKQNRPTSKFSAHGLKPQSSSLPNRKPCVCIVDDDEDILKVLQTVLQLSKIDSILKTSWNPGDESVLDSVDLALVDMHIGEVSGLKVASEIRSRGFMGPVLAMTASPTLNGSPAFNGMGENQEPETFNGLIDKTEGAMSLLRHILSHLSTLGWLSDTTKEARRELIDTNT